MRTWPCPQEGCGQVQFSVLSHGDWYSNVHGMTIDGHSISGPTHLWHFQGFPTFVLCSWILSLLVQRLNFIYKLSIFWADRLFIFIYLMFHVLITFHILNLHLIHSTLTVSNYSICICYGMNFAYHMTIGPVNSWIWTIILQRQNLDLRSHVQVQFWSKSIPSLCKSICNLYK